MLVLHFPNNIAILKHIERLTFSFFCGKNRRKKSTAIRKYQEGGFNITPLNCDYISP